MTRFDQFNVTTPNFYWFFNLLVFQDGKSGQFYQNVSKVFKQDEGLCSMMDKYIVSLKRLLFLQFKHKQASNSYPVKTVPMGGKKLWSCYSKNVKQSTVYQLGLKYLSPADTY